MQIQEKQHIAQMPNVPTSIAVRKHYQLPREQYQLAKDKAITDVRKTNSHRVHYTMDTPKHN